MGIKDRHRFTKPNERKKWIFYQGSKSVSTSKSSEQLRYHFFKELWVFLISILYDKCDETVQNIRGTQCEWFSGELQCLITHGSWNEHILLTFVISLLFLLTFLSWHFGTDMHGAHIMTILSLCIFAFVILVSDFNLPGLFCITWLWILFEAYYLALHTNESVETTDCINKTWCANTPYMFIFFFFFKYQTFP